jgi:hypothetical protein
MKKYSLIAVVIIALAALAGVAYAVHRHSANTSVEKVPQKQNAPDQTAEQAAQKNQPAQNVPVSKDLSVSDVRPTQGGDTVSATAHVTGGGSTKDSCVFTFANDIAKPVVRQVAPKCGY